MAEHKLKGKTAVITGANRGIGAAIATLFARNGAHCLLVVREREKGEAMEELLEAERLEVDISQADISNLAQVTALAMEVTQRHSTIDILVNNAGVFFDEDREMTPSALDMLVLERTLAVNLYGPIIMSTTFVPHMRKGSRIINVSSTMGQLASEGDPYGPCYSISKAALNSYTQSLAAEVRPKGIMVDAFHPGWAKTDMGGPDATVDPMESAETALFLASRPESSETGKFWRGTRTIEW